MMGMRSVELNKWPNKQLALKFNWALSFPFDLHCYKTSGSDRNHFQ